MVGQSRRDKEAGVERTRERIEALAQKRRLAWGAIDNAFFHFPHTHAIPSSFGGDKFLKKSKYLGKELPKNIDEIKAKFEEELKKVPKENKLVDSLSPLERKVIPFLKEKKLSKIVEKSNLKDVEVMRALQWLENKELIKTKKEVKEIIE